MVIAHSKSGRPTALTGVVEMDTPPSVNNAWVNVAGRGRVRSAGYRAWAKASGWTVRAARIPKISGPVAIKIRAGLPARRRDLDNIVKPILDLLTTCQVIEDDALAHRIVAEWSAEIATGKVEIVIRQFSRPQTRQLIATAMRERHAARRAARESQVAA